MKRILAHLTGSLQVSISAYRKDAGTLKSTVRMHGDKSLHIGIGGNDMTIDEAIEKHKKLKINAERTNDKRGAFYSEEEHKQIAEWLEELKKYKEKPEGYLWDEAVQQGYNKAIDDFVKGVKNLIVDLNVIRFKDIDEIAEQLKAGGENEYGSGKVCRLSD